MKARPLFAASFLLPAAALAAGILYFQGILELLPCPLCVAQRIAYLFIAAIALLAFLHDPRGPTMRRLYAAGCAFFAAVGLGIAAWQVWLIHHPEDAVSCGISPEERFLNSLPLSRWWPEMFEAMGDCLEVSWTFLGYGIPEWSAVLFAALLLIAAAAGFARR